MIINDLEEKTNAYADDMKIRMDFLTALSEIAKATKNLHHAAVVEACLVTMASMIATTMSPDNHPKIVTTLAQTLRKMLQECQKGTIQ